MQGSRPGSPSEFDDEVNEEYNDDDDDDTRTEMNAPAPKSSTGWTDASTGFNRAGGMAGPAGSATTSGSASHSQNGRQQARSATGWSDASYGAGAAWQGQQAASTYGSQASQVSKTPSAASRPAWDNAASKASSNGDAWRKNGSASVVNGAPSKAPSVVSKSGWTDVSAIPYASNGEVKSAWDSPPKVTPVKPSNGGWDDDAKSNITVGRSNAGGNTASALGLPVVEKDPWDETLSEHTVSETNGWGSVPTRGRGRGSGKRGASPPQRGRGGRRGRAREQGRG
jgi:hypothetical protein